MNGLVTIAIPTYNGSKYLAETLASVVAQTYEDLEILVVDDASKDDTVAIVKQFAQQDKRIRLVQNEQNLGLVGNWNRCLDLAKGDWIKFCFQDDLLMPNALEKLLEAAQLNDQSFVICQRQFLIDDSAIDWLKDYYINRLPKLEHFYPLGGIIDKEQIRGLVQRVGLFENVFGEPTTYFFHRSVVKEYGYFNEDLSQLCDYEFALRVASNKGIAFVADSLATFRVHGGAASSSNQQAKRFKLQYIDPLLMLHQFLHDKCYYNFRFVFSISQLQYAYQARYNELLERFGSKIANDALFPYLVKYGQLAKLRFGYGVFFYELPKRIYSKLRNLKIQPKT